MQGANLKKIIGCQMFVDKLFPDMVILKIDNVSKFSGFSCNYQVGPVCPIFQLLPYGHWRGEGDGANPDQGHG